MAIYTTHHNCARIFYLAPVQAISTLDIVSISDNFDSVIHEFAYSIDNVTWSEFMSVSDMIAAAQLAIAPEVNIYIRMQLIVTKSTKTQTFSVYELTSISIDSVLASITNIEIVNNSNVLINTNTKNLFQPYRNTTFQAELFAKMSKSISDIFSFESIYFRVEPDVSSEDITFKTYKLSSIADFKSLPVVIKDNELPYDRLMFNEFEVDFQDELEIHIVKEIFWSIFGENTKPDENDFLFLPLTNRMYEMNAVGSGDLFMNNSPFWKAYLVKYENRAAVIKTTDDFIKLDELIEIDTTFEEAKYTDEKASAVKTYNDVKEDERDNNVSNEKLYFENTEIFKWAYNYMNILNSSIAKSYTFENTSQEFSVIGWFKAQDAQIFELLDSNDNQMYQLSVINNALIGVMTNIDLVTLQLETISTSLETAIDTSKYLGIVFNYSNTLAKKLSSISVYNEQLILVHEIAEENILTLENPAQLNLFGKLYMANLRISKTFTAKISAPQQLAAMLPDTDKYHVIDNAMPILTEPN